MHSTCIRTAWIRGERECCICIKLTDSMQNHFGSALACECRVNLAVIELRPPPGTCGFHGSTIDCTCHDMSLEMMANCMPAVCDWNRTRTVESARSDYKQPKQALCLVGLRTAAKWYSRCPLEEAQHQLCPATCRMIYAGAYLGYRLLVFPYITPIVCPLYNPLYNLKGV